MRALYVCIIASIIVIYIVVTRSKEEIKAVRERDGEYKYDKYDFLGDFAKCFFISLGVSLVLTLLSTNVTTVYQKDGQWEHDDTRYFAYYHFNKDGIDVSAPAKWFKYSLYNASSKTVVMHPVVYGHPRTSSSEERTYTIKPHEYITVPFAPTYFFKSVPTRIMYSSKGSSSGRVKWVLLEEGEEINYY